MRKLFVTNTLSNKKEEFKPVNEGHVGMYVCGPTVYSSVHLGNCRTFVNFDIIFRYLKYLGYKVRYVRNITDVGHLVGDVDTGAEDKISKKARLENLEPMEIVQEYTVGFHEIMERLNVLPPSIEPRATGHILEQIEMVQDILDNGYAYEINGSVYFDTLKFSKDTGVYGKLSGRKIEDLLSETRDLKNQSEKRHSSDFAIWIKAEPTHLMRWNSPWSVGFPGWHLECSVMSTKYLGETFDFHGGGFDLKFPHHENEIAQNYGACNAAPANYWLHANMLLMNGKKMSKSDGNTITPEQLFEGDSEHITKSYSPMVVRFFMLQSHYRSTLDLTDDVLQAAEKGFNRLMEGNKTLWGLETTKSGKQSGDDEIQSMMDQVLIDLSDDFNMPKAIASMFAIVTKVNTLKNNPSDLKSISKEKLAELKQFFNDIIFKVFGLKDEQGGGASDKMESVMNMIIQMRKQAREEKNWAMSDQIRDSLANAGIVLKDGKDGTSWNFE